MERQITHMQDVSLSDNDAVPNLPTSRLLRTPHTIDDSLPTLRTENLGPQIPLRCMFLQTGVDRLPFMPPDMQCGICKEDDSHSLALKIHKCGHIFHEKCVTPWFYASATNHDKCPYCRTQLFHPDTANGVDDDQLLQDIAWLERNADDLHVLRRTVRVLDQHPDRSGAVLDLSSIVSATGSDAQLARVASPSLTSGSGQTHEIAHSLPQEILDYRERINVIERRFQVVERRVRDLVSQADATVDRLPGRATLS